MEYFIGCTHFGHNNVIKMCNRPFEDSFHMNKVMIENWNNKVSHKDIIYHLGDFALSSPNMCYETLKRLNGRKHLIVGNHEKAILKKAQNREFFESISDYLKIKINDPDAPRGLREIILFHYPIRSWDKRNYGSWHLHSHSHGNLDNGPGSIDVGVDTPWSNFTPLSYLEIKQLIIEKSNKQ